MATIYCIPKQGDFEQIDVTLAASGGFIRLTLIGQDDRQMEAHLDAAGADKLTKALLCGGKATEAEIERELRSGVEAVKPRALPPPASDVLLPQKQKKCGRGGCLRPATAGDILCREDREKVRLDVQRLQRLARWGVRDELVVNIIHWRDPKGDNEKSLCRAEERATFTGEVVATVPYPNPDGNCPACRQLYWVERAEKLEQEKEKKP